MRVDIQDKTDIIYTNSLFTGIVHAADKPAAGTTSFKNTLHDCTTIKLFENQGI